MSSNSAFRFLKLFTLTTVTSGAFFGFGKGDDEKGFSAMQGKVNPEQVTSFRIDAAQSTIQFQIEIKNDLNHVAFIKDLQVSGIRLVKGGSEPVVVGLGFGTTTEKIAPVAGFDPVSGMELPPGLSSHTVFVNLPSDAAAKANNLLAIFNTMNAGTDSRDVALLFSLAGKGGLRDPNGVEWTTVEFNKRYMANFDNLISFDTQSNGADFDFSPAGAVVMRSIGSCEIVSKDGKRFFDLTVITQNSSRKTIVMRNPKFTNLAFFGPNTRVPIGTGVGQTTEMVVITEGFPPETGLELPPGPSKHNIRVPLAADDAVAMANITDIMNIMGSPEIRSNVSMLLAIAAQAGIKDRNGLDGIRDLDATKNFKAIVKGEYLFR